MRRSLDLFVWRYLMPLMGAFMLGLAGFKLWTGDLWGAVSLVPMGFLVLIWPKVLDSAFSCGWVACSRSYDEALQDQLSGSTRELLWMASIMAKPTHSQYVHEVSQRMREMEKRHGQGD